MDNTKKPEKKNPKKGTFCLSKLIFGWIVPYLFKGSRQGLNKDDLTKCLKEDKSEDLGDKLGRQWEKEVIRARQKHRDPKLRNALFYTFYKSCFLDGFLVFMFVLIKSILPLVLAQLLIQFQDPITNNATSLESNLSFNESISNPLQTLLVLNASKPDLINSNLNRIARSIDAINENSLSNRLNDKDERPDSSSISANEPTLGDVQDLLRWIQNFAIFVWNDIIWLSTILVLLTLLSCFFAHHSEVRQRLVGARMRIACCSLIYRKTLKMSKKAAGKTAAGYLVNLLSNDVSRLDYGFIFIHYVWILPFQSAFICWLIWRKEGLAAIVGVVGLLLKTVPVQTGLSRLSSILRMRVATRTDQRVGIMNELIQGIQVIKMYAWETPFNKVVSLARKREIRQIRWASYIRGIHLSTMIFTERSTLFLAITTMILQGRTITADVVFSMAQFFNILQLTAAIFYPLAVSLGAEALVSIRRIQDFLLMEEQDKDKTMQGLHHNEGDVAVEAKGNAVELVNVSARWEDYGDNTLDSVNIKTEPGKLLAIIGPVGAGKSSLLQLLIGELPVNSGDAIVNGDISYASQEPWLFTGTVRSNILFGLPYDKRRYQEVVKHCALLTDFQQLPDGDKTVVGERGTSLSGGQKARVSLARSIYKNASIYLLDDPLSAVDSHVGRHLFDEVMGGDGYLARQNATRILVTHQVHFLKNADWIIILDKGKILMQGSYEDLANSDLDFGKLLAVEEDIEEVDDYDNSVAHEMNDDDIPYIDGVNVDGYKLLKNGSHTSVRGKSFSSSSMSVHGQEVEEDQAKGGIPFKVWKSYFLAGGNICVLIILFFMLIFSQVVTSGSDYYLRYWTQQEDVRLHNRTVTFTTYELLYMYGGLIVAVIVTNILRGWIFFTICMKASRRLHDKMFASLLNAPMRFFDTNPSGRILNRFSKDMGSIDELLPRAMIDAIQINLVMIGILAIVAFVNPMLLLALAVVIILFGCVLKLYLRPIQDMKRLEGITKSPVFSHLSATLTGLSTIRASKVQDKVAQEFDGLQNVHSSVWQLTMNANGALGLWLDIISTLFVGCVTFSFVFYKYHTEFSSSVGLAISQALILTGMVQYGIRQTAEALQQMTAVERVLQYTEFESEPNPNKRPPGDWPWKGLIEFKNMSLSYDKDSQPVLKNLNIIIQPTFKVGIVGRTGAGKSSLIGALFRLAKIDGKILIDGIDSGVVTLESLRSKISIIPQDPVLFSATIRYNLDPFDLYDDDALWRAINEVELRNSITALDYMVTEGGSNFSVGQRQLICLARAILRNNKVLVLDEATANVDPQTDALIQKTIRSKFLHCTVLTVAHRLHTVMDSDRILVMEAGSAKEYDIPHKLLQIEDGLLRNMVEATGPQESESLKKKAQEAFENIDHNKHLIKDIPNLWRFKD